MSDDYDDDVYPPIWPMLPQFAFTDGKLSPVSFDFEGCVAVKMMLTFHYGVRKQAGL